MSFPFRSWLSITCIMSGAVAAAWQSRYGQDFWTVFFVALVVNGYTSPFVMLWGILATSYEARQQRYEFILKLHTPQKPKVYPELPPDEPKTPVYFPRNDGFVQREKVDYTEFARLARVLKSVSYHIRSRDLLSDFAGVRREFGNIEGVTTEKNGVMDLTDYGIRLVNDLSALSPTEAMNPPLHITRRVTRVQHTQENTYGEVV